MARILIMDDEPSLARTLELLLRMARHTATIALNGSEGLTLLAREPFDLVLVDACLPTMSGEAVVRAIRADVRTAHLPVIGATGLVTPDDHAYLLTAGMNMVIL